MAGEHQQAGALHHVLQAVAGFPHERGIHRTQAFIQQQNLGVNGGDDAQGEADAHTAGVGAQRHVQVFAQLGELGDLLHFLFHLLAGLPQEEAADDDVFVAGNFWVHADAQVEDGGDASANVGRAAGGLVDAGEEAQKRGFTGTVVADQANPVAFPQVQVDVFEGFHHDDVAVVAPDGAAGGSQEGLFQGAGAGVEDGEVDAGIVGVDGDVGGAGGGSVEAVGEADVGGAAGGSFSGAGGGCFGTVFFAAHGGAVSSLIPSRTRGRVPSS